MRYRSSPDERLGRSGPWGAGLLGVLFALSFCPVSAALFFGSLLPLAAKNGSSVLVPSAYGAGTGLPVFVFAVLIAMGAQWVSKAFKKLVRFEKWARRVTGVIFVLVGVHYCLLYIFEVQTMKIQIAGPGCPNCQTTERNVVNACAELDLAADISHVTNIADILDLGVMRTPAVVIDGEIVVSGRVPTVPELKTILKKEALHDLLRCRQVNRQMPSLCATARGTVRGSRLS